MDLEQALAFTELKKSEGWSSKDHCTFAPNLGIKEYCDMHDCLIEFKPDDMTRLEADDLFFDGICEKARLSSFGWRYYIVAIVYWCGVRLQHYIGFGGVAMILFVLAIALAIYLTSE